MNPNASAARMPWWALAAIPLALAAFAGTLREPGLVAGALVALVGTVVLGRALVRRFGMGGVWMLAIPLSILAGELGAVGAGGQSGKVLVVDETRRSGGVSEGVVTALVDGGFTGSIRRVASEDCFIPLGGAANLVLLQEQAIEDAALALVRKA